MCGIAGFVDFNKNSSLEVLKNITNVLEHRGPNGQGFYFKEHNNALVGLGHRRLSIIDLSNGGSQPMQSQNLIITYNGEIYNYQEIKNELMALGHRFNSTSDTEVILRSWEEWGEAAIQKWRGMFAFAMLDLKKNQLICIRDRVGVKPFNYYHKDGLFIFGSEWKSIYAHPQFKKDVDLNVVATYMQFGYIPAPFTIFENTQKLRPGFMLKLDLTTGLIKEQQYWNIYDYYNRPKLNIGIQEAVTATEALMKECFDLRMVADVPVGIFLSGGYDSTCVTALLQNAHQERLHTFTIGMDDDKYNEAHHARKIAQFLGTQHTDHYCSSKEAMEIIPDLAFFYDEPFADSSAIPTMLVSKLSRKQVTVALSADGADEVFAGYKKYDFLVKYGKQVDSTPAFIKKMIGAMMDIVPSNKIPFLRKQRLFHNQYSKLRTLLESVDSRDLPKVFLQSMSDNDVAKLFKKTIQLPTTLHNSNELLPAFYDELSYHLAIDFQTYLPSDNLQKVDRATMSVSLEGREPFLDHKLTEWVAQLPSSYKNYQGTKKYIIRNIVHKYVPAELMDRPKQGFEVPISTWLKKDLRELMHETLSEHEINKYQILDPVFVRKIKDDFEAGKENYSMNLWYILMFQLWCNKWL